MKLMELKKFMTKFIQVNFGYNYDTHLISVNEISAMSFKVREYLAFAEVIIIHKERRFTFVCSVDNIINITKFFGDTSYLLFCFEVVNMNVVNEWEEKLKQQSIDKQKLEQEALLAASSTPPLNDNKENMSEAQSAKKNEKKAI